jgi:hypothetical protein
MAAQAKRKKRRARPVTIAEVDGFLASPVARHYYTFADSNVKRRLIRMLFFLRAEVDRLQRQAASQESEALAWTQRVSNKAGGQR